jgi:hypothetical protein
MPDIGRHACYRCELGASARHKAANLGVADRLASRNGLCCAFADGVSVQDVDWDSQEGHYRVRIYGQWFVVPDAAVVTEPNRFRPCRRVAL